MERLKRELDSRDWRLLRDVADFRLMTGRQLQRLHFGTGEAAARATRRALKRLTNRAVLVRLSRQIGGVRAGSSGFVYALGRAGHRLLHSDGPPRRLYEVRDGFLNHTLAIADLYVGLRTAAQGGRFELLRVEPEPLCWRRLPDGGDWLKPDLHIVLGLGEEALHSFVELDRGTEHRPTLLRKLRQYEAAYRSGTGEAHVAVFPRVVWLVPDERRAHVVRNLCRSRGLTSDLHAVAVVADALSALSGENEADERPPPVGYQKGNDELRKEVT